MTPMQSIRGALLAFAALVPALAQAEPTVKPLALQAAADYAQQARYPQGTAVLPAGAVDPLVDDRVPTRQSRLGPNGAGPRLTVWASTISALPGDTVTLYAALTTVGGAPTLLEVLPAPGTAVTGAVVSGDLAGRALGALGAVAYRDDGVAPDTLAADGIYTARFTLPASPKPALGQADSVMVTVSAALGDGELRKAAGGFQFSNPAARLTGRYTDAVRDGSLVIAAELEVLAPGRVYLSGTLADAAGQPFATAQSARTLSAGKQWLELPFYGLAFHDRGVAGAVSLASVSVTSTQGMPNALGPVVTNAHRTRPYTLAQFTRVPFNDPALLEQARRLQSEAVAVPSLQ